MRTKPVLPGLAAATGPGLIKHLGSCNTTVRSQSLKLLQSWLLSQPHRLSESDLRKLWKGLFYCLWHSDKSHNHLALINRLTYLFLSLNPPAFSMEFFRGFLVTLRREWPGIDRLRLDKFYLLIRRFVRALFEMMRLRNWDVVCLGEYVGVLEKDGFLAEDKLRGNGVCYHVVSVFLEELRGVGFPVTEEVVAVLLKPFLEVMMRAQDRILLGKVKSCVFDELVKMGRELLAKKRAGAECGDVLLGVVALRMGLSGRLYEVGSSVDCVQGNRKVLLGLHDEFFKLEKDFESSGIEIAIPEYSSSKGDSVVDDEVPQLIPIDFGASKGDVEVRSQEGDEDDKRVSEKEAKKSKKDKDGDEKKKKKKKKKRKVDNGASEIVPTIEENGDTLSVEGMESLQLNGGSEDKPSEAHPESHGALNETVILNLQKQFERVAAEMSSNNDEDLDLSDAPLIAVKRSKRKRTKGVADEQKHGDSSTGMAGVINSAAKTVEKSSKKVRFDMKNNLFWKPKTPLPPESLRLPPSVTPRGSALKKGVPPGPVIETPPSKKKAKHKKRAQAARLKSTPSLIKRRKRMQTRSA